MLVALDTETHPFAPGNMAPPLVCMSLAIGTPGETYLLPASESRAALRELLADRDITIVGLNIAYDMVVLGNGDESLLSSIFDAYYADRILDLRVLDQLIHIRRGALTHTRFSLDAISQRYLGRALDKGDDTWRRRYAELEHIPLARWPQAAIDYALLDASTTLEATLEIRQRFGEYPPLAEWARQSRADLACHLMRCQGIWADGPSVRALRAATEAELRRYDATLKAAGLIKVKSRRVRITGQVVETEHKDSKALQARVLAAYRRMGLEPPYTAGRVNRAGERIPSVSTARTTLEGTTDDALLAMVHRDRASKLLSFLPALEQATQRAPFSAYWNVLVDTGRTSCGSSRAESDDAASPGNLQNQPRSGGVRNCFVPAPGNVFITADYDCAELRALAQICYSQFGHSALRNVFLLGKGQDDPHQTLANEWPDLVPSRQFAKVPNFGFPGGLGAEKFVQYAAGYKLQVTLDAARALKAAWLRTWPEMREYFAWITRLTGDFASGEIEQYLSGRVRGGCSFTQGANTFFQGLVADGGKCALARVTREAYAVPKSPLYGYPPVAFVHDEIIIEGPRDPVRASRAADRLVKVMTEEMSKWITDLPVRASPAMMTRWLKGAKEVRNPQGLLVPYNPTTT